VIALVALLRADLGQYLVTQDDLFYRLPPSVLAPTLRLRLDKLGSAPVLRLVTENFRFADYCEPPKAGEPIVGHAHLYLNGRKHASVYEPVIFLHHLPPGEQIVTVSLNVLPDHRTIMVDGMPVSQELRLPRSDGFALREHAEGPQPRESAK
jgi:hypothetical protein